MASCIVCNQLTGAKGRVLDAVVDDKMSLRHRLQKVLGEAVVRSGWMCFSCQFDLTQIETYYSLLANFKQRYWDTATLTSGQQKPAGTVGGSSTASLLMRNFASEAILLKLNNSDLPIHSEDMATIRSQSEPPAIKTEVSSSTRTPNSTEASSVKEDPVDDKNLRNQSQVSKYRHSTSKPAIKQLKHKVMASVVARTNGRFKCPTCKKCFCRWVGLSVHMRRTHKQRPPPQSSFDINTAKRTGSAYRPHKVEKGEEAHLGKLGHESPVTDKMGYECSDTELASYDSEGTIEFDDVQEEADSDKGSDNDLLEEEEDEEKKKNGRKRGACSRRKNNVKKKLFVCRVCNETFANKLRLNKHIQEAHIENPYVCEVCNKGFPNAKRVEMHKRTHSRRAFKCSDCDKAFFKESSLNKHLVSHGKYTYVCATCNKGCTTSYGLKFHMATHTGEKPHICTICGKGFLQLGNFNSHMRIHTGEKPYSCQICSKKFTQSTSLKRHMTVHSEMRMHKCAQCDTRFKSLNGLQVHMRRLHTADGKLNERQECQMCGKVLWSRSGYDSHMRAHSGDSPFPCPECKERFKTLYYLQVHQKSHKPQSEKEVVCWTCGKIFKEESQLKYHMKTHMDRKYKCSVCDKTFITAQALSSHTLVHTGEKLYACDVCRKPFARKINLKVHMRMHNDERPYPCATCGQSFRDSSHLNKHRRTQKCKAARAAAIDPASKAGTKPRQPGLITCPKPPDASVPAMKPRPGPDVQPGQGFPVVERETEAALSLYYMTNQANGHYPRYGVHDQTYHIL